MSEEEKDPLIEWNRLNIQNAENGLIRSFFDGVLSSSPAIDQFSLWLLAGTGATAALLIANIASILPFLSESGFRVCCGFLIGSALAGLLAKQRALKIQVHAAQQKAMTESMTPILEHHTQQEKEILEHAAARQISLETEIDIERVADVFISAFPKWTHKRIKMGFNAGLRDQHSLQKSSVRNMLYQASFTTIQSLLFLAFILAATLFASTY